MAHGEGPEMTIQNDPEILATTGGQINVFEGPRPRRPQRTEVRPGSFDQVPMDPVHNAAAEPITPQRRSVAPLPRPGSHDTMPSAEALAQKQAAGNAGTLLIEVAVVPAQRGQRASVVYRVLPSGVAFAGGIPLDVFGVPLEAGRRYWVSVSEMR